LSYTYDPSGNITQIADAAQEDLYYNNSVIAPVQYFTYDALYRLIEASGREQISNNSESFDDAERMKTLGSNACRNYTQKYSYDAVGNILELQHIAPAGGGSYTRSYGYSVTPNNQLDNTTMAGVTYNYLYDARGNMLALPHLHQMGWNAHNELAYIKKTNGPDSEQAWYQYGGGERIRKYVDKGNIKEERIYLGGFEIYRKFDTSSLNPNEPVLERQTVHVSDDAGRIAMLEKRTIGTDDAKEVLTRYVHSNHLQSASLELDEEAEIISYEEYHPYGTTAFQAKSATINAVAKRYRYTGKERDEESGLYYHGARYYIPWLARWTASDPMESERAGLSPYDYCSNNPINKSDPSGMIDGWVDTGDGTNKVVYNSNVTTEEGAQAVYGSNATYYGEYRAPYVGVGGSTYELFENGNYLKDGVSHTATDKASIRDLGFSFTKAAVFTIVGAANFLSTAKPKELLLTTTNSTLQTAALMGNNDASDAYQRLNYPGSYTAHGIVPWGNTLEGTNSQNGLNKTQSDLFNQMKSWDRAQWAYESGAFTASVAMSYGIGKLASMGPGRPIAPIEGNPGSRFGMFTGTSRIDIVKPGILVTEDIIVEALQGSNMQTLQGKVSLPMVQRYVKMLENGSTAPPIKVANGIIVEGNHRYVAGRIFGLEPQQTPYTISPSQSSRAIPMSNTKVDLSDWGGH
ncbi:MAG: RHS repeat-associated core domain-containing protein, partial [Chryseobacterium sp.]